MTLIGHIDADCFYVSAERVRHRELRGVPVGVIGNQGACVIAKSYELKAMGVKTGTPIWDAVKLCPEGIYVERDFRWYEVLSRLMLDVVQSVSSRVEYYSIDEFFFDASELPRIFGGSLLEGARGLQQKLLDQVGVPASIGVSRSKTLAKLASDHRKPFGCSAFVDDDEISRFVADIDIEEVTGIGGRSAEKLRLRNIRTCGDFRRSSSKMINKLLTKKGELLWWELHGEAVAPIQTVRPLHKTIARGGSVAGSVDDPTLLHAWIVRNVERLIEALCFYRYVAENLSLILNLKSGHHIGTSASLPQATNSFEILLPTAMELMKRLLPAGAKITHMDLVAEGLSSAGIHQLSLFDAPASRVDRIKQLVNAKMGRWAIRSGATLPLVEIYSDQAHAYDICDIHGKSCF